MKKILLILLCFVLLTSCGEFYCQVYDPPNSKYCGRRTEQRREKWEKENPPIKNK